MKRFIIRIESQCACGIAASSDARTALGSSPQLASGSAAWAMMVGSLPHAATKRHTPPSTESEEHPPAARRGEKASVSPGTRMIMTAASLNPCRPTFFLCCALFKLSLQRSMTPNPKTVAPLVCRMISLSSAKRSAESTACTGSFTFFCCRLVRPKRARGSTWIVCDDPLGIAVSVNGL